MSVKFEVSEINIDVEGHLDKVRSKRFWTYAAQSWQRLYTPYVPMATGTLSQQTAITAGQSWGQIEHTAPYARYVYYGEVYGPNYPIFQAGQIVGWYSPRGKPKRPTGRKMQYNRSLHPMASAEWDKAAEWRQRPKLIRELQAFVDRGGLNLGK